MNEDPDFLTSFLFEAVREGESSVDSSDQSLLPDGSSRRSFRRGELRGRKEDNGRVSQMQADEEGKRGEGCRRNEHL